MAPPVVQEEVPWYLEDATPEWLKRIEELTKAKLKKDAEDLVNALIAKFDKLFTDSPWLVRGMKFRILELPQGQLNFSFNQTADNTNRLLRSPRPHLPLLSRQRQLE